MPMEKEACPNQRWIVPLPDYLLGVKANTMMGGGRIFLFLANRSFPQIRSHIGLNK